MRSFNLDLYFSRMYSVSSTPFKMRPIGILIEFRRGDERYVQDMTRYVHDPTPDTQDPRSKIQDPRSKIQDPRTQISFLQNKRGRSEDILEWRELNIILILAVASITAYKVFIRFGYAPYFVG